MSAEERDGSNQERQLASPVGLIEYVQWTESQLYVLGWCFLSDAPAIAFSLRVGDIQVQSVLPSDRPDVAAQFDHGALACRSGFEFQVDAPFQAEKTSIEITPIDHHLASRAGLRLDFDPRALQCPLPPAQLACRVTQTANQWLWRFHAMKCLTDLRAAWRRHSGNSSFDAVLDWGCGSARLTPLLCLEPELLRVHGCDIDAEAIAWCRANVPEAAFAAVTAGEALPYENDSFDLVLGYSVLTHLSPADQAQCLGELARTMKSGALALLTVHGPIAWKTRHPLKADALEQRGFIDTGPDPTLQGVVRDGYYREVFQSQAWTRAHMPAQLKIEACYPGGVASFQDLLVLRKPDVSRV